MSVDELIRLRKESEDKVKYVPLVRKINNTEKQLYNFGSVYNKKSIYDKDSTRTAIEQIEETFRNYISSIAGVKYDNMIAWMDIGVICKANVAKEYVESVQQSVELSDDGITYKINGDKTGIENFALQNNVLDDMVAVRMYDVTADNLGDYDTCQYEIDGLSDEESSFQSDIYLVRFDEFLNVLNALGYRVVSRERKIENFQDYLDAFMDYDNIDGFRVVVDFDNERKNQKESENSFKYLFTSGKKNEDKAGMLN